MNQSRALPSKLIQLLHLTHFLSSNGHQGTSWEIIRVNYAKSSRHKWPRSRECHRDIPGSSKLLSIVSSRLYSSFNHSSIDHRRIQSNRHNRKSNIGTFFAYIFASPAPSENKMQIVYTSPVMYF